MKKKFILVLIILACSIALNLVYSGISMLISNYQLSNNEVKAGTLDDYYINGPPEAGAVPDAKTALTISKVVLKNMFGEGIDRSGPFTVRFDEKKDLWIVEGTSNAGLLGMVNILLGAESSPTVIIHKGTGEIVSAYAMCD